MKFISDDDINKIKNNINIVDLVSSYQSVISKGGKSWIKCPFHSDGRERTPSCILNEEMNNYHCFGCGESGSIFDFVMKLDNLSFLEAAQLLAEKANITLSGTSTYTQSEKSNNTSLYELNSKIEKTFIYLLNEEHGQKAREYLKERNISEETCVKFGLGYSLGNTKWLYNFLKKKSYSDEFLRESGFFSKNKYPYPLFANRLMFPVRNWQGKVVAFGARDLSFSPTAPKYINTPETTIYSKKNNLYGLYESLTRLKKDKKAIVCEGNFDVISLHQAGFDYAVAPFGTAFTNEQVLLLSRYVDSVSLLFDSDAAGFKATLNAIVLLQKNSISCQIINLVNYKDVSEILEKEGEEGVKKALNNTESSFSYLVKNGIKMYNTLMPKGKADFIAFLKPFLEATESLVERSAYIKEVSDIIFVKEEDIVNDLKKDDKISTTTAIVDIKDRKSLHMINISHDLYLMLIFANNRHLFPSYTKVLKFTDLKDEEAQHIFIALENMRRSNIGSSDENFLSLIQNKSIRDDISISFTLEEYRIENVEAVINDIIKRIDLRNLKNKSKFLAQQVKQCENDNLNELDFTTLLKEKFEIDKQITKLSNELFERE